MSLYRLISSITEITIMNKYTFVIKLSLFGSSGSSSLLSLAKSTTCVVIPST